MTQILNFLINNLLLLHFGSIKFQLKATLLLSAPLSILAYIGEKITNWAITDSDYILAVSACVLIDLFIGIWKHLKDGDFNLGKLAKGLVLKIGLCAAALITFELMNMIVKEVSLVYDYLKVITRMVVVLYPAGSAFMNMSDITGGVFPPIGWINKIKKFNTDLDINQLKEKSNEEEPLI